jgi:hypothetical protein
MNESITLAVAVESGRETKRRRLLRAATVWSGILP